ncbi:hypothetical protein ACH5RR_020863 [Cinchona calisaya]|uniref:Uncharacterized protein n=1 Tax=Cinchona calisaya TaxID=153742 RepID=A0ABD2ZGR8_9GENT
MIIGFSSQVPNTSLNFYPSNLVSGATSPVRQPRGIHASALPTSTPGLLGPSPFSYASSNNSNIVCQLCNMASHTVPACKARDNPLKSFNTMTVTEPSEST